MFFFALVTHAQHIEQWEVNNLAQCWRNLHYEYGASLDMMYYCKSDTFCRLQIATCSVMLSPAASNGTVAVSSDTTFSLVFERVSMQRFCVTLRDHFHQGVASCSSVDIITRTRKRQLSEFVLSQHIGVPLNQISSGFVDTGALGNRQSCTTDRCPDRWKDCCWDKDCDRLLGLKILVFAHSSFCKLFDTEPECAAYVEGMIRDSNNVYENQLGISIVFDTFIPPSVLSRHWKKAASALDTMEAADDGEHVICVAESLTIKKTKCSNLDVSTDDDPKKYLEKVVGRRFDRFSFFHLLVDIFYLNGTSGRHILGTAFLNGICNDQSVGYTTYDGHLTWTIFAHELAHNLKAQNFVDTGASAPKGDGLMGKDNTVAGIYSFHDYHMTAMCKAVKDHIEEKNSSCVSVFFWTPRYNTRVLFFHGVIGRRHELEVFVMFMLLFGVCCCGASLGMMIFLFYRARKRNIGLLALCKKPSFQCSSDQLDRYDCSSSNSFSISKSTRSTRLASVFASRPFCKN